MYIPQELNTPLLVGGFLAWFVSNRTKDEKLKNARFQRGTLIASGFIAGGALFGVINALLRFIDQQISFGYSKLYNEKWAESTGGEVLGLLMFILFFGYALWDAMRAKK